MSEVTEVVQIVLSPMNVASMVPGRRESHGKPDQRNGHKNMFGN